MTFKQTAEAVNMGRGRTSPTNPIKSNGENAANEPDEFKQQ
jgi:hypothetical protein